MKSSLLVLVLEGLLSAVLVSAQTGNMCDDAISALCPEVDPTSPFYIAVPDNCREYCECSDQVAYLFSCAPGTLFDDVLMICNWDYLVDCGSRSTVSPVTTPKTSTVIPSIPSSMPTSRPSTTTAFKITTEETTDITTEEATQITTEEWST